MRVPALSRESAIEKSSNKTLFDELASLPSDFLGAAVKAAYVNPVKGTSQLLSHLAGKKDAHQSVAETHPAFMSLRWHAHQLGGAVGTMAPYFLCNKLALGMGIGKVAAPFATGILMEGLLRPVEATGGEFAKARAINALTGSLTFGTLGHLPSYLKGLDAKRFGLDQPWLVNSFTSDLKRHVLSGAAAGVVDTESRSVLSGKGINVGPELVESVYTYGALGGLMHGATEVVPHLTKGSSINDIVHQNSYLSSRAKLDPVAKELLYEHGHLRIKHTDRKASKDIYDLFAHAKVAEAIALKQHLSKNAAPQLSSELDSLFAPLKPLESKSLPIAELLADTHAILNTQPSASIHPLAAYREAMKNSPHRVSKILGAGIDSMAFQLENGDVLKLSLKSRTGQKGTRTYDMPILEQGQFDTAQIRQGIEANPNSRHWDRQQLVWLEKPDRAVNYVIQPKAEMKIPYEVQLRFSDHMSKLGDVFWDFGHNSLEQLGYFDGRIVLIDYFAVEPIAVRKAIEDKRDNRPLPTRLEELFSKL